MAIPRNWPPERIRRFIKDWDSGLEAFAMREKWGNYTAKARYLRRPGHALKVRQPGLLPPNRIIAPEHTAAMWTRMTPEKARMLGRKRQLPLEAS